MRTSFLSPTFKASRKGWMLFFQQKPSSHFMFHSKLQNLGLSGFQVFGQHELCLNLALPVGRFGFLHHRVVHFAAEAGHQMILRIGWLLSLFGLIGMYIPTYTIIQTIQTIKLRMKNSASALHFHCLLSTSSTVVKHHEQRR